GAILCAASMATQAAQVILVNTDPAGVGFNETTPATPLGGNSGTTVGEQRLIAYGRALQLWGSVLKSNVPITVLGSFSPLTCTATGGTLAQAGAWNIEVNFPGAPLPNTLYHSALANSIAGFDIYPGTDIVDGADIVAFFNGSLGSPGCLEGSTWYYGLDSNTPAGTVNFLNVFMHELSHGLGFSNFVNEATGGRLAGFDDVYMANTRDNVSGKLWTQMTTAEIKAAAVHDWQEVWVGPNVTARAPLVLGKATLLATNAIGDTDFLAGAAFGAPATSAAFTGDVVAGLDAADGAGPSINDGCSAFSNASAVAGKIAIVRRGTCGFVVKAKNAQNAGARAVIIANNAVGGMPIGLGGTDPSVTIPAISVGTDAGTALINAGTFHSNGFVQSATRLAGTDTEGHVRIYAPTTVAPGSSGSHWDVSAEPSLLLEPFDTPLLQASHNIDLTAALFEDIGWKTEISVANCGAGSGTPGESATGEIYAAPIFICADNAKNKGQFQSCSVHALQDLMKGGIISGSTKGSLGTCTAQAGQ
ncbi:MAG TPA: PA domain-containing protein, partial [Usitatibacter sp.]|nr:PA domain-containing protein [Usitatibacter sp.]